MPFDHHNAPLFPECRAVSEPQIAPARNVVADLVWSPSHPVYATFGKPEVVQAWQDVGVANLLDVLGPNKFLRLMVSPTGVFGFYDGKVPVDTRDNQVYIRHNTDGDEIEVPHIRFEAEAQMMMQQWLRKGPGDFFMAPDEHCYFRSIGGVMDVPRVARSLPVSIPTDRRTLREVNLYVSQPGTVTNLHYDPVCGAVCQLKGRKRVVLFPPTETDKFNMHPSDHLLARRSRHAGRLTPEYIGAHPELRSAKGMEYVLQPGEWLLQPKGWLHYIETLDADTISLIVTFRA